MHYLIDGHNLIGKCRTIALGAPDDEAQVIDLLHRWLLRRGKHQITVFFDGGVYGHPISLDRSGIRTVFAHSPQDADARLIKLLSRLETAHTHRLVTSDRAIAQAAVERGIAVIDAAAFAAEIEQRTPQRDRVVPQRSKHRRARIEPKVAKAEVDQWLREFGMPPEE